jgi:hypothetical protein
MRFRKLRIAWSVGCSLACLLLIVLWVRSYWTSYFFRSMNSIVCVACDSNLGEIECSFWRAGQAPFPLVANNLEFDSYKPQQQPECVGESVGLSETQMPMGEHLWDAWFPHWFASIVAVIFAATPWIRWSNRFSLRTLLFATTLVAVLLGLIVL